MKISYKAIGSNIRKARKAQRLTQEKTAELLGISALHYGRLERGDRRISLDQVARIADVLAVSFDDLIHDAVFYDPAALHEMISIHSRRTPEEDRKYAETIYQAIQDYEG